MSKSHSMRQFETGANRNSEDGKLDFEGFFSPLVLERVAQYMHQYRYLEDGTLRDSDNWQKLFGEDHYSVCMKSAWRHFHDMWMEHRGYKSRDGMDNAINGLLFNVMAYQLKRLLEELEHPKDKGYNK